MTSMMRCTLRGLAALLLLAGAFAAVPAHAACDARPRPGDDLQQALDALPADGAAKTVCLAAGEYRLHGLVAIRRDAVTLRGAGARTVLRMQDGVAQPLLVVGEPAEEVPARAIRDVTIEQMRLIGAPAPQEFMPEHPYLSNSGVVVRRGERVTLRRLELDRCRSACILTERDTRDVTIEDSRVIGAVWDGVSFNRTAGVKMIGNEVRGNVAAGITAEHLEDSEIRDNTIAANGSHGVYLSDSLRNRFEGNRFERNRHAGVFLTCAVRFRDPGPVLCWDNSMSQANVFEDNRFERNQYGYDVGADRAANCALPQWQPNLWRGNRSDTPNRDPQPGQLGRCTRDA